MRSLIYCLLLECLLLPPLAGAQQDRWQNLEQIKPGNKVEVIDRHLKQYSGKFVRFSENELTVSINGQETTLARNEIYRVTSTGKNRRRNLLLGLALGAGAGAALGAAIMERESGYSGAVAGTTVGFAGVGAGVGALVPSNKTIYRTEAVKEASLKAGTD